MSEVNEARVLIIGNGFDLAHHLPTSYHDFITFAKILTEYKGDWSNVSFGDIFHEKTEAAVGFRASRLQSLQKYYDVSDLYFDLTSLENKLNNAWLDYFKPIHEIETWIDFENEINSALKVVENYVKLSEGRVSKGESFIRIVHDPKVDYESIFIQRIDARKLHRLKLIVAKDGHGNDLEDPDTARGYHVNFKFAKYGEKYGTSGVSEAKIIDYLFEELQKLIGIFSAYLINVVDLISRNVNKNELEPFEQYKDIYSFNYTKTIENFYNMKNVWHLHGDIQNIENLNIVLGVNEVDTKILGTASLSFTKYFQTLFNETNFEFLDHEVSPVQLYDGIDYFIWGHSLDKSDEKYIKRLFHEISFTAAESKKIAFDVIDSLHERNKCVPKSTITVYYHDQASKARLLKNLLDIIGKDVIQKSIITNKLVFEKSPAIWRS